MSKHLLYALLWGSLMLLTACGESAYSGGPVPYARVNYTLSLQEYPNFVKANGFQVLPPVTSKRYEYDYIGYAGLLIWVGTDQAYHAADLCCPNCLLPDKPVTVDGSCAVCPICGEQYDLLQGYAFPQRGFTRYALRAYNVQERVSVVGTELHITN